MKGTIEDSSKNAGNMSVSSNPKALHASLNHWRDQTSTTDTLFSPTLRPTSPSYASMGGQTDKLGNMELANMRLQIANRGM